jgi:alpha-tubulin suppressor-like RCC1 family protein
MYSIKFTFFKSKSALLIGILSLFSLASSAQDWMDIASGDGFAVAIKSDSTLWAWGDNGSGQLGIGNNSSRANPVQVGTSNKWVKVEAGQEHVLALRADGTVWAWGDNANGQLGLGTQIGPRLTPVQVATNAKEIACGFLSSFYIHTNGDLYAWGANYSAQLGTGNTVRELSPTKIGTRKWTNIASGRDHSMGVSADSLYTWGGNDQLQLGRTGVTRIFPTYLASVSGSNQQIACGDKVNAVIISGDLYEFGNGQLSVESGIGKNWVAISITNKTLIATHTVAGVNKLMAKGANTFGEGGTGTNTNMVTLTDVPNSDSVMLAVAGWDASYLVKSTAANIMCVTGNNATNQLGISGFSSVNSFTCLLPSDRVFSASNSMSDAKVAINWDLNITEAHRAHNPEVYIQIREVVSKREVYSEILDSVNNFNSIKGSITTLIKPGREIEYEFRILEYGPGTALLNQVLAYGTTLVFQKPDISANAINPWSIELGLKSNSDYDTELFLLRDNKVIATLDTTAKGYSDFCNILDPNAIVNGQSYSYQVVSVNSADQDSVFSDLTVTQNTYNVAFTASKNTLDDHVELTWNDLSVYADKLEVIKDGNRVAELDASATSYHDLTPIPGHLHEYKLKIISDDEVQVSLVDSGSIKANGFISGYVFNEAATGDVTVPNVSVQLAGIVNGDSVAFSTTTNSIGYYEFDEIAYHVSSGFTVSLRLTSGTVVVNDIAVTLNQSAYVLDIDFEVAVPTNELASLTYSLDSFSSASKDSLGYVQLDWTVTSSDTVYYYIYRNDELQKVGLQTGANASYQDNSGTPLARYEYSIRTYARSYNTSSGEYDYVFDKLKSASAQYPQPFAIPAASFVVTPRDTFADMRITWQHPQGNIDGFKVYRNDQIIATLDKSELEFIDLTGANNAVYTYAINCHKIIDEKVFNSSKVFNQNKQYPQLRKPDGFAVASNPSRFVDLTWDYPVNAAYNYDGFYVLREYAGDVDTLASIRKSLPFAYTDPRGVPQRAYTYSIQAYKTSLLSSSAASDVQNVTYPPLPKLAAVSSAANLQELISLNTRIDTKFHYLDIAVQSEDLSRTYSQYRASKGQTVFPYVDYPKTAVPFSVTTVKTVDGVEYFGEDTTLYIAALPASSPSYTLDSVTNLTASTNYSSHVKLHWEYPDYYIPEFRIFRDGVLIETVEGVHKTYYDHDVYDNEPHVYQVQVNIANNLSPKNAVIGQMIGSARVYGSTHTDQGKQGIENSTITLYISDTTGGGFSRYATATTNASGYYEFLNVPTQGLTMNSLFAIDAQHPNARFMEARIVKAFDPAQNAYAADFIDTLPHSFIAEDTIAIPINIDAVTNMQNHSVDIRWQASNANYTSFEVYRGLALIATVDASQTKLVIDNAGVPGYDYSYRIRAIWQKDRTTKKEGSYFNVVQRFPVIQPVENLSNSSVHDGIRVNWSHPSDVNIDYLVLRNGDLFWHVKSGENLEILDTIGTIGNIYKYTVIPVLSVDLSVQGIDLSTVAVFPSVSKVKNLNAGINLINGNRLTWTNPSNRVRNFFIYVNDRLIDTFYSSSTTIVYACHEGIPNATNTYSIASAYRSNGKYYRGKKVNASSNHPVLRKPTIMSSSVVDDYRELEIYSAANI